MLFNFWALYSFPLIYVLYLMPIQCYFNYHSFVVYFKKHCGGYSIFLSFFPFFVSWGDTEFYQSFLLIYCMIMFFALSSEDMMYNKYWFFNLELQLHGWHKSHLTMMSHLFYSVLKLLLNSLRMFASTLSKTSVCGFFCVCVMFWDQSDTQLDKKIGQRSTLFGAS